MPTKGRIYIAGPMTGVVDHNYPAFKAAAKHLEAQGWEVVNPADNYGGRKDLPRASYLRVDIALLLQCQAMALLPGWQCSRGALLEHQLALELEMHIIELTDEQAPGVEGAVDPDDDCWTPSTPKATSAKRSILEEAARLTSVDRFDAYGHPSQDFARTALMWNGILAAKLRPGCEITTLDVPLCMIAVKMAREVHRHKRDNLVDIAGYAQTAAVVTEGA